jgi:hypothetical protein
MTIRMTILAVGLIPIQFLGYDLGMIDVVVLMAITGYLVWKVIKRTFKLSG